MIRLEKKQRQDFSVLPLLFHATKRVVYSSPTL